MKKYLHIGALLVLAGLVGLGPGVQAAQSSSRVGGNNKKQQQKKSNGNHLMSPDTYKKLQKSQKEMSNKKYNQALSDLRDLYSDVKDSGSKYEQAVALQNIAYVYLDQGKYKKGEPYLKRALDLNSLPSYVQDNTTLTLAKVYTSNEEYHKSLNILLPWIRQARQRQQKANKKKKKKKINQQLPGAYIAAATDYGQLNEYKKAIPYVKTAIKLSDDNHQPWYQLWLASAYQIKDYKQATNVLIKMLSLWPGKKQYWKQLAQTYLQRKKDKDALSTYAVAYQRGALDQTQDLITLAQLYILGDDPYQGAKVLEKGIKSGKIKPNLQHLQLLASAWSSAQETDKALKVLGQAAAKAKKGDIYMRQAALYQQQQEWTKAYKAAHQAIAKGGLDNPGQAYLIAGMASAKAKKYQQAIDSFQHAAKYGKSKKQASQWIKYVHGLAQQS